MTIKDHGVWRKYVPRDYEAMGIPRGALCLRRDGDGFDWYEYVNIVADNPAHADRKHQFDLSSVKAVIDEVKDKDGTTVTIIRTAAVDATRLFPQEARLVELTHIVRDQNEEALLEEFLWRKIDLKSGELGPKWEQSTPPVDDRVATMLEKILARLERLEKHP